MAGTIPKPVAMALKALAEGVASAGQQKAALDWILFDICRLRDPSYVDGEKPLASAHNEGRRMVGLMIAGAIEARPVSSPTHTVNRKLIREAKSDE